jgi:hypothetical protein
MSTELAALSENIDYRALAKEIRVLPEFKAIKPRQRAFILAFAKTFNIQGAALKSGIPWVNHYAWLKNSETYRQAFEYAKQIAADTAEGDVYERAFVGEKREVTTQRGNSVVTETYKDKSDILAIFMLKGLRPQYRDNFSINNFSGPVQLNTSFGGNVVDPLDVTDKAELIESSAASKE